MSDAIILPEGYRFYDPPTRAPGVDTQATSDAELYGGATMNWAPGGDGKWYLGCCAEKAGDNPPFKFRAFRLDGSHLVEVPLPETGSGRGWLDTSPLDGYMYYAAWEGKTIRPVTGPGRVPGVPPVPISGASVVGGAYVPIQPNAYYAGLDGASISGARSLDIPSLFGVPRGRAYCVRLVAQAASPNTRVRLGTEQQPGQLTVNTQIAGLQLHSVGVVNATTSGGLWLSIVDGTGAAGVSAQVWLTVAGLWPG